jgi:hypothetical protein
VVWWISEREIVVAEDGDGVYGLVEVKGGEASCVAGAKPGISARERCEPVVGDEDEPVEVGSEAIQKRRWGQLAGGHEGEAASAGREHGEDCAGFGPGGSAGEATEEAAIVEAEEVDAARCGQEREEAVFHARSSSAARTT